MRTVLITGTSTGIGLVTAVALAARGWRVFATMRNLQKKEALQDAVRMAGLQDRISIEQLDVADGASIEKAVASILSRTGGTLDAVVHNAGTAVAGVLEDLPDSEIRRVFETNFFGVLRLTRAVLPAFRAAKHGRIVIVSSEAAFCGQPLNSIYCASKWAVEGWAESLAFEVFQFGVDVVLVEPGPHRSEIWHSSPRVMPRDSPYFAWSQRVLTNADRHYERIAGDPKNVADAIVKAVEAPHPRFRYPVGPFARLNHFLRGKLPTWLIRRGTKRYLGLPMSR
jgi:NAD(P)-dependent dehydrogenase (short-subunit alcohol dehydrogenase family)